MSLFPFNPNAGQKIQGTLSTTPTLDMGFIAHWSKSPAAAAAANIMALTAQPASSTTTVTTFSAQPDVARNVTCVGNQATCTGNLVVNGTNLNGDTITETLAINGTSTVVGNKAFASITSVVIPTQGAGGDQVSLGVGSKLGLHHKLTHNTTFFAFLNNTKEGTAPTVAVSSTVLESNTFTLNSALNGNVVDLYYIV